MRRLPNYSDTSILGYDLLTLCYAIVFSVFFFFLNYCFVFVILIINYFVI